MSWWRPRDHNILANLSSLLLCGLIAGVVVAAAFFPGVALSGLIAKESFERFDQLPSQLIVDDGPQITYVYAADNETRIAAMYDEFRRNVPLHDISPHMINAIIAAEDKNFYEHNGVDPRGIARAFIANTAADEVAQGASTLTMQLVRLSLTYFSEDLQDVVDATEDTNERKLREVRYAIALEQSLSKDEILNRYLNLAYFGEGAYGIFAASQVYFQKRPSDLEIHEAAFLAGLVQSPSQYSPTYDEGRTQATERRNWVLDQMVDTEAITPQQAAEAKAIELDIEPQRQANMCVGVPENHWGFFCDYLYRWWLEQETFGATPWERERALRGGGFRIVTSLDLDVQEAMKERVEQYLPTGDEKALMLAAVEPGTGRVLGLATNRIFGLDDPDDPQNGPHTDPRKRELGLRGTYPITTNPLLTGGGDIDGYQYGSTFKLFTMIAALEEGLPLAYSINSPYRVVTSFPVEPGGPASCGNRWCPVNFSESVSGRHNMWTGFGQSVNTYFAQLIDRIGPAKAVDVAKRLGIKFRSSGDEEHPSDAQFAEEPRVNSWGAFTLGVSLTTPLDVAAAFAAVSNEGVYCEPIPVVEIQTLEGESLDIANPHCQRAIDENVALSAIDAGRCVVGVQSLFGRCRGSTAAYITGTGQSTRQVVDAPLWGKSGTTDNDRTAALTLSTSEVAMSGVVADPDWAETNQRMDHGIVNPAVTYALADAMKDREGHDWGRPDGERIVFGDLVSIPDVECRSVGDAQRILEDAGFEVRVDPERVDSDCAPGQAAGTNPSGRTVAGDEVVIEVSNGSGFDEDEDDDNSGPGGGGPGGPGGPGDPGGGDGGGGGGDDFPPLPIPTISPTPRFGTN
ncbi:MAG TPA: transglycosylase domain-containing protein [Natronosporangium sp.]